MGQRLAYRNTKLSEIGKVSSFASNNIPSVDTHLYCDGSSLLKNDFPELYAVIGDHYGSVDTDHFNLPDMRGQFPRGFDDGRGLDTGRILGSEQSDAMQGHRHYINHGTDGGAGTVWVAGTGGSGRTGYVDHGIGAGVLTDGTNGTPRNAIETRPTNLTFKFFIRYAV